MRAYRRTAFGDVAVDTTTPAPAVTPAPVVAPVPATTVAPDPGVAARTPPFTAQTFGLLAVAAIPWVPVAAGMWIGERADEDNGRLIGGATGFLISFLTLRHILKKNAGTIT